MTSVARFNIFICCVFWEHLFFSFYFNKATVERNRAANVHSCRTEWNRLRELSCYVKSANIWLYPVSLVAEYVCVVDKNHSVLFVQRTGKHDDKKRHSHFLPWLTPNHLKFHVLFCILYFVMLYFQSARAHARTHARTHTRTHTHTHTHTPEYKLSYQWCRWEHPMGWCHLCSRGWGWEEHTPCRCH